MTMADTHANRMADTHTSTHGTHDATETTQGMSISQLIDRLTELYLTHGKVPVRVAGAEGGPGEPSPAVLSIHTAEWDRAEGEPVVIYLDVTG